VEELSAFFFAASASSRSAAAENALVSLDASMDYDQYGFTLRLHECGFQAEETIVVARLLRSRADTPHHALPSTTLPPLRTLRLHGNPITQTIGGGHSRIGAYALLRAILYAALPCTQRDHTSPHLSFPAVRPRPTAAAAAAASHGCPECVDLSHCGLSELFSPSLLVASLHRGYAVFGTVAADFLDTIAETQRRTLSSYCILIRMDRFAFLEACRTAQWEIPRHFRSGDPEEDDPCDPP
jgi:hypothetical protein